MNREATRLIKDFPFYATRLQQIDWQAAIAAGEDWHDPNFPAQENSIVDEDMTRTERH